jgi:hypothetical protein
LGGGQDSQKRERPATSPLIWYSIGFADGTSASWLATACLESGHHLDAYETGLIRTVIVYRRYVPLPEQLEWLREIADRVLVKTAAA